MKKLMKLDDSTLTNVSGGRGLRLGVWKKLERTSIAQENVAVVFAPGNKGTISIDQDNTAVVL
jgi:hypothetical protein